MSDGSSRGPGRNGSASNAAISVMILHRLYTRNRIHCDGDNEDHSTQARRG